MPRGFPPLLAIVLALGIAALAVETCGFRAVTAAGARQLAVERTPRPVPNVALVDQTGAVFALDEYKGRPLLIDFIYTRCPTVCGELGEDFARLIALAGARADAPTLDFVSISFDPAHDDRGALALYGERFGAKAPHWRVAAPRDADGLAALLKTFGVVVIPDGMGGFIHNSAVYVVDGRSRLVRVLDAASPAEIYAGALQAVAP